jgi:hypothetical protein
MSPPLSIDIDPLLIPGSLAAFLPNNAVSIAVVSAYLSLMLLDAKETFLD